MRNHTSWAPVREPTHTHTHSTHTPLAHKLNESDAHSVTRHAARAADDAATPAHHACWTTMHAGPHARRDARTHTTRVTHTCPCPCSHVQSIQAEERQGFGGVSLCASRPGSLTPPPRFPHATAPAPSRHRPELGASSGHLQAIDTTLAAISTYSCAIAHSDTNSHPSTNRSSSLSMRASSLVLAAIACGAAGAS